MTPKKSTFLFMIMGVLLLLYLLFWPVPIDPKAWKTPKAPSLSGKYAPNNYLAQAEKLATGEGFAPEDVAIDSLGRIYAGMSDGRIIRLNADTGRAEVFADTKGRPLGLHFDDLDNLVVADGAQGLLSISSEGEIRVLCKAIDNLPFGITNDVDIARDGTIYFSDASYKYPLADYSLDGLEHRPNGRLLAYDPITRTKRTVLDELYFANGVAVSPDQSFILVCETWKYRVKRYWLTGPRRGETDIFIDNLPGFPDGISSNGEDTFWLTLVSPRDPMLDMLLAWPFLRKVLLRLPKNFIPETKAYGFILGLDHEGRVIHNLQDPQGNYAFISSVEEHEGMLYLGSIAEDAIGCVPVPPAL